jgi:hypothetical protein
MFLEWAPLAIFNRPAGDARTLEGDEQQSTARSPAANDSRLKESPVADGDLGDSAETGSPLCDDLAELVLAPCPCKPRDALPS